MPRKTNSNCKSAFKSGTIRSGKSGGLYVMKRSSKTGKMYKLYCMSMCNVDLHFYFILNLHRHFSIHLGFYYNDIWLILHAFSKLRNCCVHCS